MIRGSCLCGGVCFEVHGEPILSYYCHCSRCRKTSGAAFVAPMLVPAGSVRFTAGKELVTDYHLEGTRYRNHFCRVCGCDVPATRQEPDLPLESVPLGALDDDPHCPPSGHIYVGSKAAWDTIGDELPQFEEGVPDEMQEQILRGERPAGS